MAVEQIGGSLPTRAWELLIGAALALYRAQGGKVAGWTGALSAWTGTGLIVRSIVLANDTAAFPGRIAAFPVIGAALLIAPVGDADAAPLRLLRHPWMAAVGKRSYSIYLWHWPVFSFVDYSLFRSSETTRTLLKIGLTLVLTVLSYALVERPARRLLNAPLRRRALFGATALVVAALVAGGIGLRSSLYFDVPPTLIASGGAVVRGGEKAAILLSGDSQAAMYGTEIGAIARERGATLYGVGTAGRNQLPGEAGTNWPIVAHLIAEKKPDLVILIDAWSDKLVGNPAALRQALADIGANAKHVLLVTQVPTVPDSASRDGFRRGAGPPFFEPAADHAAHLAHTAMVHGFAGPNVTVLDVSPVLVGADGAIRVLAPSGRLSYFDLHHLSDEGTRMRHPALARAIDAALAAK